MNESSGWGPFFESTRCAIAMPAQFTTTFTVEPSSCSATSSAFETSFSSNTWSRNNAAFQISTEPLLIFSLPVKSFAGAHGMGGQGRKRIVHTHIHADEAPALSVLSQLFQQC